MGQKSETAKKGFGEYGLGLASWLARYANRAGSLALASFKTCEFNYAGLFVNINWRKIASEPANNKLLPSFRANLLGLITGLPQLAAKLSIQ